MKDLKTMLSEANDMPSEKIEGFLREFPRIRSLVGADSLETVRRVFVSRATPELLAMTMNFDRRHGYLSSYSVFDTLWLLDENWEIVTATVSNVPRKLFGFFGPIIQTRKIIRGVVHYDQTAIDKIRELGPAEVRIRTILLHSGLFDTLIVFKIPRKAPPLHEWVETEESRIEKIAKEFAASAAAIENA